MTTLVAALDSAKELKNSPRYRRWMRSHVKLARLKASRRGAPLAARTFWGAEMTVTVGEPLSNMVYLYGFHEYSLTRMFLHEIREGMTVVDIGAHYGYFTLLAAHLVGAMGSVHSFEPTPSTYAILASNTARYGNVRTNQAAAWNRTDTLELQDFGPERSMFNSVFSPRSEISQGRLVTVPAVPVGDYLQERGVIPDLIKIDAESAESQVAEGLDEVLRQSRPMLTVEVGDSSVDQPLASRALLDTVCLNYGYVPFEFTDGYLQRHKPRKSYEYDNILLAPANRAR